MFRMVGGDIEKYYDLTGAWEEVRRPDLNDFPEVRGRAMVFEREFMRRDTEPSARLVVEWDTNRHISWYAINGKDGTATDAAAFMAEIKEKMK